MARITKQDLVEWIESPVTKWYRDKLREEKADLEEQLAGGSTLDPAPGATAQLTARIVGEIAGLNFAINRDFLDTIQEDELSDD